jgi:hypothetical protein
MICTVEMTCGTLVICMALTSLRGRPQRLPLGMTAHGREILSEVYFLSDAEIPSEGALCSAATDYRKFM